MADQDARPALTVYMIGNAHIDPVWLWTRSEGRQVTLDTFRTVVDLLAEYPEMLFTSAQAQLYAWVEEDDPVLFGRIRELVAAGRWHVAGGMWVQPDCNLPSGEAFVRQLLYAQRYFHSRLGVRATVGYNVDSFGHAGTLPQLLRGAGMDSYVYFRPDPRREVSLDEELYWWQSPDGSRVLACRPPNHYGTWAGEIENWIVRSVVHAPERAGGVLCFYGVGDHGGGPTRANLDSIRAVAARQDLPQIRHGSLREFFDRAAAARDDYGTRRNDLQHHAPGCYSAESNVKRWNRRAEQKLVAAEKANAVASALAGGPVAGNGAFEEAWRLVLFSQFHDILAGTSIPEAYREVAEDHAEADRMAEGVARAALARLAAVTDCRGEGEPTLVFNPCSWEATALIELEGEPEGAMVAGSPVPAQRAHDGKLLVRASVPALGVACIHLAASPGQAIVPEGPARARGSTLENGRWRLEVDRATGEWISLLDKKEGVEVLSQPGNALVVLDDPSDTWSHGVTGYYTQVGRFGEASVEVVESGPLRASLLVRRRYGRSWAEERVSLHAGEGPVAVQLTVDWHDTRKALKVAFPVAVEYPVCTYEVPYGVTMRVPNGEEEPGQTWVDATGVALARDGRPVPYGVSLISDSKYAFSMDERIPVRGRERTDTELRMTILRSPPYAFHDPRPFDPTETYAFIDQGEQTVRYWLLPHRDSWREAGTVREAHRLNAPVLRLPVAPRQGGLPPTWSFLECPTDGVEVGALKRAEDSEALVIRLVETCGRDCTARLGFPLWGALLEVPLGHYQIKTLAVEAAEGSLTATEVNLLEEPVPGGFSASLRL
ncbi:MAG: alpha-mannosidase [Anaerolineae bacterium]|nr:alpha-mannosidase [Anaerolineae bacterium]